MLKIIFLKIVLTFMFMLLFVFYFLWGILFVFEGFLVWFFLCITYTLFEMKGEKDEYYINFHMLTPIPKNCPPRLGLWNAVLHEHLVFELQLFHILMTDREIICDTFHCYS